MRDTSAILPRYLRPRIEELYHMGFRHAGI